MSVKVVFLRFGGVHNRMSEQSELTGGVVIALLNGETKSSARCADGGESNREQQMQRIDNEIQTDQLYSATNAVLCI